MSPRLRASWPAVTLVLVAAFLATSFPAASTSGAVTPSVVAPYTVTFSETGLPHGTNWSVHVAYLGCSCDGVYKTGRSNSSSVTIAVTNGTYKYHVLIVSGYWVNQTEIGTFVVSGANVTGPSFVFHPLVTYPVAFQETGLPNGTPWTVTVSGNGTGQLRTLEHKSGTSDTSNLTFELPNASYRYAVTPVNGSFFLNRTGHGLFAVVGASPAPVAVRFTTPPLYAVTVFEAGLPLGTNWSAKVVGWGGVRIKDVASSSASSITFFVPNGTYRWVVGQVLGFAVNGSFYGSIHVTNSSTNLSVVYRQLLPGAFYAVAFEEAGLANGTHWSATVLATHTFGRSRTLTQSSNTTTDFFLLQNDTYRYVVHPHRGYTIESGGSGAFTISGSSPSVFLVTFKVVPTYAVTINETGLDSTNWTVLLRSEFRGSTPWPIREVRTIGGSSVTFYLPNGSYCFNVFAIPGYYFQGGYHAGPISVVGASPATITVNFLPKA